MTVESGALNRDLPVPLYYQISQLIEAEIEQGKLRPGDLFTTEQELQRRFQVSRATARKAIEVLEQRGLLVRVVGKGTFVAAPQLQVAQPHLLSFTEEMRQRGIVPGAQVLDSAIVIPPLHVRKELHLEKTQRVLLVKRLRTGNGEPMLYVAHHLPTWLPLDPNADFSDSLYRILEGKLGIGLSEAVHRLEGSLASEEEGRLLGVAPGFPVLRFQRTVIDRQGRAIVYEEGCARADRYRYEVRLKRR